MDSKKLIDEIRRTHRTAKYISLAFPFIWILIQLVVESLSSQATFNLDLIFALQIITIYIYCYLLYRIGLFVYVFEMN